jgi:hypothetical protein
MTTTAMTASHSGATSSQPTGLMDTQARLPWPSGQE